MIDWTILASTAKINVFLKNILSVQKGVLGGWVVNKALAIAIRSIAIAIAIAAKKAIEYCNMQ